MNELKPFLYFHFNLAKFCSDSCYNYCNISVADSGKVKSVSSGHETSNKEVDVTLSGPDVVLNI